MSSKTLALALALATGIAGAGFARAPSATDSRIPIEAVAPLTTLPSYQSLVSAYYKANVYDQNDHKVGQIKDMLVQNGAINAVLLSVGGFLGIGEKDVAVPLDAINVSQRDGKWQLTINATKQILKDAPAYVYDRKTAQWQPKSG